MKVDYSKTFKKQYQRLRENEKNRVKRSVYEFLEKYPNLSSSLRNHNLSGKYAGFSSISAGDDLRIHYYIDNDEVMLCVALGTHSELYE
ncbi:MAG: type II toxin-antitoxin system YafQ family toxin [Candidatus Ancillula sp.]|jgi:addiction module RelE/StbE family toxin|nr:type II toxin-antitoxin system YafQ family toxin [Candidatus Ancillula sp.]